MKPIFSLLLLIFLLPAAAQETKQDSAYIADYHKLRDLYIKSVEADKDNESYALYKNFMRKAHFKGTAGETSRPDALINYVRQNIAQTDFKSIEEAEAEWAKFQAASKISPEQNEFMKVMMEMSKIHGRQIAIDVMMNKGAGNEDPREEPEYIAAVQKLTTLIDKQQNSDTYRQWRSLDSDYRKKANFDTKTDKLEMGETMFDWVEKNLEKTMFTSVMQAEQEWKPVELAEQAEEKDNAEFHEYYLYTVKRFGPNVYMDAMSED